ncbi:plasma membrane ascorbate-dependent reductase CYBRD1-like [Pungitius pungitius]|uniref:plasma membrane ascorbate-dependent reductase CYBRD1-like n=1 Tax=Pungitius pungitius TaxID=134920 RepID=UPI002E1507C1
MENFIHFVLSLSAAVFFGIASIVFVVVWVSHFGEGVAWDAGMAEFNWHPVLVVTGYIFLQGLAIVVYRIPWTWRFNKLTMKFVHAGLHLLAFIFAVIAMAAVFDFHNASAIPNMYSLHSWLGLVALTLFCLQFVLGVGIYLIPVTPASWRAAFMPLHVYSGLLLFGSVIAVALMGFTEELLLGLDNPQYKDSPPEAIFVNVLGFLLVVFGALIVWIATRPAWKRPSDQVLPNLRSDGLRVENSNVGSAMAELSNGADGETWGDVRKRSGNH